MVVELFDRITVDGLSIDGTMMALSILLNRAIAGCVTFDGMTVTGASFDRMTSFLSVLAFARLDAAELWLAGVHKD